MGFNIERADKPFVVKSPYKPSGDQPQAIAELAERVENGENDVVLMGATGTGKTATTAWLIEKLQRPTLIIEPNKTLAAQLCAEFRELMPDNAVSYFVSYYDYYQPEAYIPQTDTYIEKDSNINDDVERLRHQATANLLTRRDCVVVATVSCIYGLGTPEEYAGRMLFLKVGQEINRDDLLRQFVAMQYKRNDIAFTRGTFRVRGDTVEIIPVYEELAVRIEFFGDEIDRISTLHPLTGDEIDEENEVHIFPASHYVAGPERMERALKTIREELEERLAELRKQGKELEAQRLNMRTTYDLEMLTQVGVCSGVENYSRYFSPMYPNGFSMNRRKPISAAPYSEGCSATGGTNTRIFTFGYPRISERSRPSSTVASSSPKCVHSPPNSTVSTSTRFTAEAMAETSTSVTPA